jgi:hypothetical protein
MSHGGGFRLDAAEPMTVKAGHSAAEVVHVERNRFDGAVWL